MTDDKTTSGVSNTYNYITLMLVNRLNFSDFGTVFFHPLLLFLFLPLPRRCRLPPPPSLLPSNSSSSTSYSTSSSSFPPCSSSFSSSSSSSSSFSFSSSTPPPPP